MAIAAFKIGDPYALALDVVHVFVGMRPLRPGVGEDDVVGHGDLLEQGQCDYGRAVHPRAIT